MPLDEIDTLEIHFDIEDLRGMYDRRAELTGEDALEPEEVSALDRIARHGPGLVHGSEEVERFEKRLELERADHVSEQLEEAEKRITASLAEANTLVGETLRRYWATVVDADATSRKFLCDGLFQETQLSRWPK